MVRPEDTSTSTGEESDTVQSTHGSDDRSGSKPVAGHPGLDGCKRNSTPLRKPINVATWNVYGMSEVKLEVVAKEMLENNIGISELCWLWTRKVYNDDCYGGLLRKRKWKERKRCRFHC